MGLHLVPRRYKVLVSVARTGPGTPGAHFGGKFRGAEGSSIQQFHVMTPGGPKNVQNLFKINPKKIPRRACPPPKLGPTAVRNGSQIDLNWAKRPYPTDGHKNGVVPPTQQGAEGAKTLRFPNFFHFFRMPAAPGSRPTGHNFGARFGASIYGYI